MAKILFVEDDLQMAAALVDALRAEKHVVDAVHTASAGREYLKAYRYDLLILDWQLPDGSGLELCRDFRLLDSSTPVLILTGKDATQDKTTGLDSGADDYITKPFSTEELAARIRALLRRLQTASDKLTYSNIELDRVGKKATVANNEMRLRPREFALLEYLIGHADRLLSHNILRNHVWWDEVDVERNTINAMVARLRTKLKEAGADVNIRSVPGEGFWFETQSPNESRGDAMRRPI